ncbi:MAG TPA: Rieske (2Fe-2S) protein [Candidatus Saccharimonadales bacterium]|nr:Rieske (2Fe-2S) protein [Candidatus Saccharimonadales bacterium]
MLERWAKPLSGLSNALARLMDAIFRPLGRPGKLLQDFLNGSWLGHSVHPVVTDVVVGGATGAVLLQVLIWFGVTDLDVALIWLLGLTWLSALSAVVTGLTDFKDTATGDERNVVGLHGEINILATVLFIAAFGAAVAGASGAAAWFLVAGYLVLTVGAFIGGHVVYKYGYMVNFNAFTRSKRAKEFIAVLPVADLPEATPTRAALGATGLVLVRRGDVVYALNETCPHAGGPLAEGHLDGDTIVCPWHGSALRLSDGAVRHGPSTSRQVAYRARINGEQVEVQGPIA